MSKPLFTITTDDLYFIRDSYVEDMNWWKEHYKKKIYINYPHEYIQFKERQIKLINLELIRRGEVL